MTSFSVRLPTGPIASSVWELIRVWVENEIVGEALVALRHEELKEMAVMSVGHRLTILKGVYDIKIKQEIPFNPDHYIPPCMLENELPRKFSHLLTLHQRPMQACTIKRRPKKILPESSSQLRAGIGGYRVQKPSSGKSQKIIEGSGMSCYRCSGWPKINRSRYRIQARVRA